MLNFLRQLPFRFNTIKTSVRKDSSVVQNAMSFGLIQIANFVIPLATIPYLTRTIGVELFGLIAFATSTIMYFLLFTDYGFNISGTTQVVKGRENPNRINEIFWSIFFIKFIIMFVGLSILTLIILNIEHFHKHWDLYFITYGIVLGQCLTPLWLFQGMERVKTFAAINILVKIINVLAIFIFVSNKSDFIIVAIINSASSITIGALSFIISIHIFKIQFLFPKIEDMKFQIKEGWHVFISSMSISIYSISSTFLLGVFSNTTTVGYFSAAEKIIQAAKSIYQPFSQALFPIVGRAFLKDFDHGQRIVSLFLKCGSPLMLFASAVLFIFPTEICIFVFGKEFMGSGQYLRIMSFIPLIVFFSNIFGIQVMLNMSMERVFSRILVFAAILGTILNIAIVPMYKGIGSAFIILFIEIVVTILMYIYIKTKKIL